MSWVGPQIDIHASYDSQPRPRYSARLITRCTLPELEPMSSFTLDNPAFRIYVIAASLAILKMLGHGFLTVYRMIKSNGGFLNPEDTRKTISNPNPSSEQLAPNDYVERARRMHRNEGENTPLFLVAGLLFVAASPSIPLASTLMFGYVAARVAHTYAYVTEHDHEVRAAFFSIGALLTIIMTVYALAAAIVVG
jgi:glutathione S-transferase